MTGPGTLDWQTEVDPLVAAPVAAAMLPPEGQDERAFRPIIVGSGNSDPYPEHGDAIAALAEHLGLTLDPARCYPYRRG